MYIKAVIFLLILNMFSSSVFAENVETSCGIKNGKVIVADGTICREDLAFGLVNDIFPSLIGEIAPIWDLSMFQRAGGSLDKVDLSENKTNDTVFFVLFDLFYNLVLYVLFFYIGLVLLNVLLKALKGWDFLGNTESDGETDTIATYTFGAFATTFFLFPFKQFFIGQLLVFTLGVVSLSFVNFIFSIVLSSQESNYSNTINTYISKTKVNDFGEVNRYDYLSDTYLRYLLRMELCQRETANYLLSKQATFIGTPSNLMERHHCLYGNDAPLSSTDLSMFPNFTTISSVELATPIDDTFSYRYFSGVNYGVDTRKTNSERCALKDSDYLNYSCGSISIEEPNWGGNPLVGLIGHEAIMNHLSVFSQSYLSTMTPAQLKELSSSSWRSLLSLVTDKLTHYKSIMKVGNIDAMSPHELDVYKTYLLDKNNRGKQKLIVSWYQAINNIVTFGQYYQKKDDTKTGGSWVDVTPLNTGSLTYYQKKIAKIADIVQEIQCNDFTYGLNESKNTLNFILGETTSLSNVMTRCLNFKKKELIGFDPYLESRPIEKTRVLAVKRFKELNSVLQAEWGKLTTDYILKRRAVEASYIQEIQNFSQKNWWHDMRKEGFLSIATYAYRVNSEINFMARGLELIVNNFTLNKTNYDGRYISVDSIEKESESQTDDFPYYLAGDEAINNTNIKYRSIDRLVNRSFWVSAKEQLMRQPSLYTDPSDSFNEMLSFLSAPTAHLSRLGLSLNGNEKDPKLCITEPSKCPFPLTDPLIELSQFGHDLLQTGLTFYVTTLSMKGIVMNISNYKAGNLEKGKKKVNDFTGSLSKYRKRFKRGALPRGAISSVSNAIFDFTEFIYSVLGIVMIWLVIIGAILYYGLPLIPLLYVYFGFISWFMVLVLASFSVLLWSVFWIRFKEKRNIIQEALLHYGMELMLKPTFILITVMFAYYFFYIVAFVIGVTLGWLNYLPSTSTSSLSSMLMPLIHWVVILFIYFVGLKYCYKLMDDLTNEMLTKLGVKHQQANDKISELVKAVMFNSIQNKHDVMNKKLAQQLGQSLARLEQAKKASKQDKAGG